jgi:hypothetical protein
MSYGAVYVLSRHGHLFSVHLGKVTRWDFSDWEGGTYSQRTPRTIKRPDALLLEQPRLHVRRGPEGHGLVHFGEGAWWKRETP